MPAPQGRTRRPLLVWFALWRIRRHLTRHGGEWPPSLKLALWIGIADGWYEAETQRTGDPEIVAAFRRTLPDVWRQFIAAQADR